MIKGLLPFRGFFVHFDLVCLNLHPGAGIPWRKISIFCSAEQWRMPK
jgi:hypothetical protein